LPEERIAFVDTTSGIDVGEVLSGDVIWETAAASKVREPEKVRELLSRAAQKMFQLQQPVNFHSFPLENDFLGKEVESFIYRILQEVGADN